MFQTLRRAARAAKTGGAAFACLAAAALPMPLHASAPPPADIERTFAPVCARALRSVVCVLGQREVGDDGVAGGTSTGPRAALSFASGVVVDRRGHIVTSASVVRDCERVQVRLADGRSAPAVLLGTDESADVALLEIAITDVPPMRWAGPGGDAAGVWVAAVGQSVGGRPRSSLGVVKRRYAQPLGSMLLLTNAVFPGFSGAPAVNARGELVGLVIGPLADAPADFDGADGAGGGSSFALAGDDLRTLVSHLERYGHARRGFLGVRMVQGEVVDATHPADPFKIGVRVEDVLPGSPAAQAGLRAGDLIVGWNGETLSSPEDLMRRVEGVPPGTKAALVWVRGDDRFDGSLFVGAKPADELLAEPAPSTGAPPGAGGAQLPELRPQTNPYLLERVRSMRSQAGASADTVRRTHPG
jgi:S1-C subfamily serine protease